MACKYFIINEAGEKIEFQSKDEVIKYVKDNNLAEKTVKGVPEKNTATLANVLRQMSFGENNFNPTELNAFQEDLLTEFIRIEDQSQFFYKMGPIVALTKGLGKSFDTIEAVKRNLVDLGIGAKDMEGIPFDVRYLLTGDKQYTTENGGKYVHKITANNLKIMNEVSTLSKTMFIQQSPTFVNNTDKMVANLKDNTPSDKVSEIKDELSAFYQIAAYKQWIALNESTSSTLRNSIIYDNEGKEKTIVDIVKEVVALAPNNNFLKFILPVTTTLKMGKKKVKNIINRDLINTVEGKTRGRLEPDLMATMMDSFAELYHNPKTQFHAKALFDYLIVKDGLMFKNKSFIKMIPTFMFKEMSEATDIASKALSATTLDEFKVVVKNIANFEASDKEGNEKPFFTEEEKKQINSLFKDNNLSGIKDKVFNRVFGMGYNEAYNRFQKIYATDARFQFNLTLIRPEIRLDNNASKKVKAITFAEEEGKKYMHVAMFTDEFKAAEEGSDERSKIFKNTMQDLSKAGFTTKEIEDPKTGKSKTNLVFKNFVRVRGNKNKYTTYQLVAVERAGKLRSLESMTATGDLTPSGTYAVYSPVDVVGTSNSTGVADVGVRPTKEQVLSLVNKSIESPAATFTQSEQTPQEIAPETTNETPTNVVSGGIFGGLQQMAFDPNEADMSGLDIGDEEINKSLDNLDDCSK